MACAVIVDDQPGFGGQLSILLAQSGLVVSTQAAEIPVAEEPVYSAVPDLAVHLRTIWIPRP